MPGAATYLTRPVFDWPIDWQATPQGRITFDLREVALGFGAERFWSAQNYVAHGWSFDVELRGDAEISGFDDWFEELGGRMTGFWLPTPVEAFRITAGSSTTEFIAEDIRRDETLADLPELHLWFTKPGATAIAAKVADVTDNGDGTCTVELTGATTPAVDETWHCWWLQYVRQADDEERGEALGEQAVVRSVRVIELPNEYAALETGRQPIWLYRFYTLDGGTPQSWRFTSFAWDLNDGTDDWTAKAITHTRLMRTISGRGNEGVTIKTEFEAGNPLYQLIPCAMGMPLFIEIRETTWGNLGTQSVRFIGRFTKPDLEGKTITAPAAALRDIIGGSVPTFQLQPRCNYRVYEGSTCRASQASFEKVATITSISGREVVVAGVALAALAADWFAEGFLQVGTGPEMERRTILTSTAANGSNEVTLTLNHRLFYAAASDAVTVIPGCDGKAVTCASKFSNFVNFGGHRWALKNLTLQALAIPEVDASKK